MPVVYDGVGKDTFPASLDCLSPRGMFVSFGNASGPVAAVRHPAAVAEGLAVRDAADARHLRGEARAAMLAMAEELFALVLAGKIVSEPRQTFALKDAAEAHRALESRETTGATVLLP